MKMKTIKAIAKRVKKTANGRILFRRAGTRHLQQGKSRKVKRQLSAWAELKNRPWVRAYALHARD